MLRGGVGSSLTIVKNNKDSHPALRIPSQSAYKLDSLYIHNDTLTQGYGGHGLEASVDSGSDTFNLDVKHFEITAADDAFHNAQGTINISNVETLNFSTAKNMPLSQNSGSALWNRAVDTASRTVINAGENGANISLITYGSQGAIRNYSTSKNYASVTIDATHQNSKGKVYLEANNGYGIYAQTFLEKGEVDIKSGENRIQAKNGIYNSQKDGKISLEAVEVQKQNDYRFAGSNVINADKYGIYTKSNASTELSAFNENKITAGTNGIEILGNKATTALKSKLNIVHAEQYGIYNYGSGTQVSLAADTNMISGSTALYATKDIHSKINISGETNLVTAGKIGIKTEGSNIELKGSSNQISGTGNDDDNIIAISNGLLSEKQGGNVNITAVDSNQILGSVESYGNNSQTIIESSNLNDFNSSHVIEGASVQGTVSNVYSKSGTVKINSKQSSFTSRLADSSEHIAQLWSEGGRIEIEGNINLNAASGADNNAKYTAGNAIVSNGANAFIGINSSNTGGGRRIFF